MRKLSRVELEGAPSIIKELYLLKQAKLPVSEESEKSAKDEYPDYWEDTIHQFVWFSKEGSCAMRRVGNRYFRDGGHWDTNFTIKNGVMYSSGNSNMRNLNGHELIPCTEEEWRKDNGEYAPSLNPVTEDDEILDDLPF